MSLPANGEPGMLVLQGDEPIAFTAIEASPAGVERIHFVVNPDKLAHLRAPM